MFGRVCPTKTSSGNGTSGEEGETLVDNDPDCKIGYCDKCDTGRSKCRCIAVTYFQYPPMRHKSSGNGEYVVLPDTIADYNESTERCSIRYIYVHGVGSIGDKTASNRYGEGSNYSTDAVEFLVNANSKISISSCTKSDKGGDNNRGYMDTLTVGDQEMSFKHCSSTSGPLTYSSGGAQPYRGYGACYWCQLRDIEDHGSNKNYMSDTGSKDDWWKTAKFREESEILK